MTQDVREAVAENPLWYHTIDLGGGIVTPGWFDLRPIIERMPWPDVRGKRCLDVGTYDGHLAFELERRGAAEVVATDIDDHTQWDWPPDVRAQGPEALAAIAGPEKGLGFRIAKDALGSSVERVPLSVYDLSRETVGEFDVVVCGSLLLHLRDPLGALEAIRSICRGRFLSADHVDLRLTVAHPRRPVVRLNGAGGLLHWWVPNTWGLRRMLFSAGFEIERRTRPYCIPYGPAHPRSRTARGMARHTLQRLVTGGTDVPHAAFLVRPRV